MVEDVAGATTVEEVTLTPVGRGGRSATVSKPRDRSSVAPQASSPGLVTRRAFALLLRAHAHGAVAFAAAGTGIASRGQASYDEIVAGDSAVSFDPGWGLMRWFLG